MAVPCNKKYKDFMSCIDEKVALKRIMFLKHINSTENMKSRMWKWFSTCEMTKQWKEVYKNVYVCNDAQIQNIININQTNNLVTAPYSVKTRAKYCIRRSRISPVITATQEKDLLLVLKFLCYHFRWDTSPGSCLNRNV